MKLVPIIFGVGIIYGSASMLIHMFGLFNKANSYFAWINVTGDMNIIILAGLLPLIAYIGFILSFLVIDIIRSILSIPEKIERLIKK